MGRKRRRSVATGPIPAKVAPSTANERGEEAGGRCWPRGAALSSAPPFRSAPRAGPLGAQLTGSSGPPPPPRGTAGGLRYGAARRPLSFPAGGLPPPAAPPPGPRRWSPPRLGAARRLSSSPPRAESLPHRLSSATGPGFASRFRTAAAAPPSAGPPSPRPGPGDTGLCGRDTGRARCGRSSRSRRPLCVESPPVPCPPTHSPGPGHPGSSAFQRSVVLCEGEAPAGPAPPGVPAAGAVSVVVPRHSRFLGTMGDKPAVSSGVSAG